MYTLYIDESGKNNFKGIDPNRPHFSLASIIVKNGEKDALKIAADKIKFKYWGNRQDVCFHAAEMRRLGGIYSIFRPNRNPALTIDDLQNDIIEFLNQQQVLIGLVCANKQNFIAQNPPLSEALLKGYNQKRGGYRDVIVGNQKNILRELTHLTLCMYLHILVQNNAYGQIVVEASNMHQDVIMMAVYNDLLSHGCASLNLQGYQVRELLTSISFVSKKNDDIETQLADLAAYYLNLDARVIDNIDTVAAGSFEESVIDALKSKTFLYQDAVGNVTQNSFTKLY